MTISASWRLGAGLALALAAILSGILIQNVEAVQRPPKDIEYQWPEEMKP